MKKILIPTLVAVLITGAATYGINKVNAETNESDLPPMIQRLVEKFNLNKDDVTKFVNEERTTRQAEMQKKFEDKLTELVKNGKLTESQKTALIAKHNEMKANRQNIRNTTKEERHEKMEAERTAYEAWAKSQGIDLSLIRPEGKGFGVERRGL